MFGLVVCSVLISSVLGGPVLYGGPIPIQVPVGLVASAPAAVVPLPLLHTIRSQFHSQDELGQYSYGYSNEHSSKVETKDFTGLTSGGYSYIDANGLVQNINYIADDTNGFRVAASNLPVAPVAHPIVPVGPVAPLYPVAALPVLPEPVSDTPEVQKAKEEHEKAKAEAIKAVAEAEKAVSESSDESQSTETSSSEESTEETAEGETKPYSSGPEAAPATSPATPVSSTEKNEDGSSQSDEGSQSVEVPSGEAPVVAPEFTIDGAQFHSYIGNPLFRAGPPYLTYLPGAYVALNKRETPVASYGGHVSYQPEIKLQSAQGAWTRRLSSSPSKFPSERANLDSNVVSKR